jgi:iron complex outermembrane receptor protein
MTLGVGLIETEFQDSATINSAGVIYDIKGHGLPMTPPVTVNGTLRYGAPFAGGELWGQIDGAWRDAHFFTTDESEREGSDAYGLLNARAGWEAPSGTYAIELFVENVTDEEYLLFAADQNPDLGAVTWGRPRWAGVTLRARY